MLLEMNKSVKMEKGLGSGGGAQLMYLQCMENIKLT